MQVLQAVESGEVVNYSVTPLYEGTNLVPYAVEIIAEGDQGFYLATTVLNK